MDKFKINNWLKGKFTNPAQYPGRSSFHDETVTPLIFVPKLTEILEIIGEDCLPDGERLTKN